MTSRALTDGEIREARRCLTNHLDYGRVRVHNTLWFPAQPDDTAMTPRGEIHFPPAHYLADFSTAGVSSMAWLVHEIAHCWQHQNGQWVMLRGIYERQYRYGAITATTDFSKFNIEQQASVVEDYYNLLNGGTPRRGSGAIADYRSCIPMTTPR
jgi:hypothetical protein